MLRSIDWSAPAALLDRIMRCEAVHEIASREALRDRLEPEDRRCFGDFHPDAPDEPLIFVSVALMREAPHSIGEILREGREVIRAEEATTAVFYSISNCQPGLRGVSFGKFLIKDTAAILKGELPQLTAFVTLSPVSGFARWLSAERAAGGPAVLDGQERAALALLDDPEWPRDAEKAARLGPALVEAVTFYLTEARDRRGRPIDQVARFHLGNGARLQRINVLADRSPKAMREAHGLMVNYLYDHPEADGNPPEDGGPTTDIEAV